MQDEDIQLLLVEDNPGDARLVLEMLSQQPGIQIEMVDHLAEALERLDSADIVLLDLSLPDSQGLDTLAQVRTGHPAMPIIVLTGLDDGAIDLQAVKTGAQDYLVKGHFDEYSLPRAIRYAIERKRAEELLNEKLDELRSWHAITLSREVRILDLKREVNDLLTQAGRPPRYISAKTDDTV